VIRGRGRQNEMRGISHRRGDAVAILAFRIASTRQQECKVHGPPWDGVWEPRFDRFARRRRFGQRLGCLHCCGNDMGLP